MDLTKIQTALKFGSIAQRQELEKLFSEVNSIVDAVPAVNEQKQSYITMSEPSIEVDKLADKSDKHITGVNIIQNQFQYSSEGYTEHVGSSTNNMVNVFNLHQRQRFATLTKSIQSAKTIVPMKRNSCFENVSHENEQLSQSFEYYVDITSDNTLVDADPRSYLKSITNNMVTDLTNQPQRGFATLTKSMESAKTIESIQHNIYHNDVLIGDQDLSQSIKGYLDKPWKELYNGSSENYAGSNNSAILFDADVNELTLLHPPGRHRLATLTESMESARTIVPMKRNSCCENVSFEHEHRRLSHQSLEGCLDMQWKHLNNGSSNNNNMENHILVDADLNYVHPSYLENIADNATNEHNPGESLSSSSSVLDGTYICSAPPVIHQPLLDATYTCSTPTVIYQKVVETASGSNFSEKPAVNDIIDSDVDSQDTTSIKEADEIDEVEMVADEKPEKNIKLTRIHQSNNYHDQNDYLYTRTITRTLTTSYFRCKNYVREGCHARVIAKDNDMSNAILRGVHSHLPVKNDVNNEKFNKTLDAVFKENEFEKPLKLYLKAKKKLCNVIDTSNIATPKSKESFIRRRKIAKVPKLPKTIEEFQSQRNKPFYRGVWEKDGSSKNIVYISQETLDLLNTLDNVTLLMDGTFKILPRHFRRRFRQLYVINFIYQGRCYPLAYILTQKKDFETYDLIFDRLKRMIPSVTITGCMTDFEPATRKALMKHFPEATISGCFFHYVQAIHKAFKRHGMIKDEKFQSALQEVSALALLPNDYILSGFEAIKKRMELLNSKRWERFCIYWEKQWPGANISVFGLAHRSNNFSESLNNITNSLNGTNPNIWKLISNLQLTDMHKSDELKCHIHGQIFSSRKPGKTTRLDKDIEEATHIFEKTKDVEEFLKTITFNKKFESFFKERIFLVGLDDDFDDDCGEYEDVIIPNTFNVELNFDRHLLKRKASKQEGNDKKRRITLAV